MAGKKTSSLLPCTIMAHSPPDTYPFGTGYSGALSSSQYSQQSFYCASGLHGYEWQASVPFVSKNFSQARQHVEQYFTEGRQAPALSVAGSTHSTGNWGGSVLVSWLSKPSHKVREMWGGCETGNNEAGARLGCKIGAGSQGAAVSWYTIAPSLYKEVMEKDAPGRRDSWTRRPRPGKETEQSRLPLKVPIHTSSASLGSQEPDRVRLRIWLSGMLFLRTSLGTANAFRD